MMYLRAVALCLAAAAVFVVLIPLAALANAIAWLGGIVARRPGS